MRRCGGLLWLVLLVGSPLAVQGQEPPPTATNRSGIEFSAGALFVIPSLFFGQGSLGVWSKGRWSVRFKANYSSHRYDHYWLLFLDAKYRLTPEENEGAYVFFGPGAFTQGQGLFPWVTAGLGLQYALDKSGSSGVYTEIRFAPPFLIAVGVSGGAYFRF